MVDITTEIIINKPIHLVADYAANPDNAPEWYVNIRSAEWKTSKPLSVGSRVAFVADFLGKKLVYTYEVVEFIPLQKLLMQTAEEPFPMQTTYIWKAIDDTTTQMTLRNRGNPTGFSKLFAPFMAAMMRKANVKDLNNIKRIIESR